MPKANMCHIVVGCGGTGAKTAEKLAQLMSQDPRWRHEMDEHVYFLLVDTDAGDLEKYKSRISESAPNVYVDSLLTSEGFNSPFEIVEYFRKAIDELPESQRRAGVETLAKHWWMKHPDSADGHGAGLFQVPMVSDLRAGAGQVPMVSYLATWIAMRNNPRNPTTLESKLNDLCERIANTRSIMPAPDGTPLDGFNIMFIGSVAGGTGRGCSVPIAFKMKEVFWKKFGGMPSISGYFLNEDCFSAGRDSHEELPQMMNAMTGWSELSAWVTQFQRAHGAEDSAHETVWYTLPGTVEMTNPAYDVLSPPQDHLRASLPFDAVGVIGRQAGNTFFAKSPDELYQMLSTGLYVRITQSHVHSKRSNDSRTYFSVGTSIAEIPFEELRAYFGKQARLEAATKVSQKLEDAAVAGEITKVMDFLGFQRNAVEKFLEFEVGNEPKTLLEKLANDLTTDGGPVEVMVSELADALRSQSLDASLAAAQALNADGGMDSTARDVRNRFERILRNHFSSKLGRDIKDPAEIVSATVDLVCGVEDSVFSRTGSAAAVAAVARGCRAALVGLTEPGGLFSDDKVDQLAGAGKSAAELVDQFKGREGPLGIGGKRFSDDEIAQILAAARRQARWRFAKALGRALAAPAPVGGAAGSPGLANAAGMVLASLAKNADVVQQVVQNVLGQSGINPKELASLRDKLFVNERRMDASLGVGETGDAGYMIRRRVCPLYPDTARLRLQAPQFISEIRGVMLGESLENVGPMGLTKVAQPMKRALDAVRFKIDTGSGNVDVMDTMHLGPVLRDLGERWLSYLNEVYQEDLDRYKEVEQRFRNFFGIQPRTLDGKITLEASDDYKKYADAAGEDYLMLGLATVCSRTCRPFWNTKNGRGESPRLTVQVPMQVAPQQKEKWKSSIQSASNLRATGASDVVELLDAFAGNSEKPLNQFILAVYTSSGVSTLEEVTSLDGWKSNPVLQRCLQQAESRSEPMPFSDQKKMWAGYRGSGFTDPIYVNDPALRSARWRPWVPEDQRKQDGQGGVTPELIQALVYARKGAGWFITTALGEEAGPALAAAEKGGIKCKPILESGNRNSVIVGRRRQRIKAKGIGEALIDEPSPESQVAGSWDILIRDVAEMLNQPGAANLVKQIQTEYSAFMEHFAADHGFHPEYGKAGFARIVSALRAEALDEQDKTGATKEFWKAVYKMADRLSNA